MFSYPQLLNHHVPNIPLPQPDIPQGAEASSLSNSPWEFPRNRVDLQVVLGSGAFGLVMKGQAQGIKGCVGKMYVAVKIVKGKSLISATCPWLTRLFFSFVRLLVHIFEESHVGFVMPVYMILYERKIQ